MQSMQIIPPEFQQIKNPYIVNTPIVSKDKFFGREEDFASIREWITADRFPVLLLTGSCRSGKTSLLMQIKNNRINDLCESVFFDCATVISRIKKDSDFSLEIAKSILKNPVFAPFEDQFYKKNKSTPRQCLKNLVDACIYSIRPKKFVILLDEIENLEDVFTNQKLKNHAFETINDILTKPVFFILTSSDYYAGKNISEIFGHITQQKAMYELSLEDTTLLITQPTKGILDYEEKTIKEIYRLSGGEAFFTQYICHSLVDYVNTELKKSTVNLKDLKEVVNFIINNPAGYIQETWKKFSHANDFPKHTLHFLSALAASIKNSHQYVSRKQLLQIQKERNFTFSNQDLKILIGFFKTHRCLVEWNGKGFRFRIDIIRLWIIYYYQTGKDIEKYLLDTINPKKIYTKKLCELLIKQPLNFKHRQELKKLQQSLELSYEQTETIENELRKQLKLRAINWQQEYESNCLYIKNKYSDEDIAIKLKLMNTLYISSSRLSQSKARDICKQYGLIPVVKPSWFVGGIVTALIVGVLIGMYSYASIKDNRFLIANYFIDTQGVEDEKKQLKSSDNDKNYNINKLLSTTGEEIDKNKIHNAIKKTERRKFTNRNTALLNKEKTAPINADFVEIISLCNHLNEKINSTMNKELRMLYLLTLEKSLEFIPKQTTNEQYKKWLEVQKNNIEKDDEGRYHISKKFRQEVTHKEKLYGSIEMNKAPIDIEVMLKNKGENFPCKASHKCKTPLKKTFILAGKKIFNFSNKDYSINIEDTINIHPNQHFVYSLE